MQDVGDHGCCRRLSVCSCHGDGEMLFRYFAQGFRAFYQGDAALTDDVQLVEVVGNGWGVDGEVNMSRNKSGIVFVMNGHPFVFELAGEERRRKVIARHFGATALVIPCQGAHPNAANTQKIYPSSFFTNHINR